MLTRHGLLDDDACLSASVTHVPAVMRMARQRRSRLVTATYGKPAASGVAVRCKTDSCITTVGYAARAAPRNASRTDARSAAVEGFPLS